MVLSITPRGKATGKLIIGLGNPDPNYSFTRHNSGAQAVKRFARKNKLVFKKNSFLNSLIAQGKISTQTVFLLLPQTFMNVCGRAASAFLKKRQIALKNILVVYDDVALPLGELRFKAQGSSGGHNGLTSVMDSVASKDFARLRIGIGGCAYCDLSEYVLSRFHESEGPLLDEVLNTAVEAMTAWICEGVETCMSCYNKKKKKSGIRR